MCLLWKSHHLCKAWYLRGTQSKLDKCMKNAVVESSMIQNCSPALNSPWDILVYIQIRWCEACVCSQWECGQSVVKLGDGPTLV